MTEQPKTTRPGDGRIVGLLRSRAGRAVCILLALSGLGLAFEHRVHLLASLPLLLPLAICLGMHLFMHRGHGGGHK